MDSRLAAVASSGSMLEMQDPKPDLANQKLWRWGPESVFSAVFQVIPNAANSLKTIALEPNRCSAVLVMVTTTIML